MRMGEREELNKITEGIIGAAIEVHRHLGLGLLESDYQAALAYELSQHGYKVEQQSLYRCYTKKSNWTPAIDSISS